MVSMRTTNARMRLLLAEYDSEYGHVCLVNKRLFSLMTTNENLVNEFIQIKHREMRAIRTLKPGRTTVAGPKYYTSRSSAICHLLSFKTEFDSNEYHVVKASPLGPCMKITIPDWKNSTKGLTVPFNLVGWLKVDLNHREWPKTILLSFSFVFIAVFQYYSLAFLCLFYPTEILQRWRYSYHSWGSKGKLFLFWKRGNLVQSKNIHFESFYHTSSIYCQCNRLCGFWTWRSFQNLIIHKALYSVRYLLLFSGFLHIIFLEKVIESKALFPL